MLSELHCQTHVMSAPKAGIENLRLDSPLSCLPLYDFQLEVTQLGLEVAQQFEKYPLLPGVILSDNGNFIGIISQQRFLEYISRPFGRELFLRRPLTALYRLAQAEVLVFSGDTLIVDATKQSLQRSPQFLYEPIVVELSHQVYRLLNINELLVAQSYIHELATQLLKQKTQAQLLQTQKLASLGRMVASVAHEIRNPVNCIMGNGQFLSKYLQDLIQMLSVYHSQITTITPEIESIKEEIEWDFLQEDLPQVLQSMQGGTERLNDLVSSLRNFCYMDDGVCREINIHEYIDSTLMILKNRFQSRIKIQKNYGDLPRISCYPGQLSQVFMNLLMNALDALEEGRGTSKVTPTITIETEIFNLNSCQEDCQTSEPIENLTLDSFKEPKPNSGLSSLTLFSPEAEPEKVQKGTWLAIRIADNGPGILPEMQQQIFESFLTTKPVGQGTGVGLAISYQIITEKHRGKLNFHSTPGIGTEFEILLPLL